MRVFLTGATGFVGAEVARSLLRERHAVRALKRPSTTPSRALLDADIEWHVGDLLDERAIRPALDGVDAVIHAAAEVGYTRALAGRQRQVNVDGTRALAEAAARAGVRRFVYTSSISAIGHPEGSAIADEETPFNWPPGLGYHESKRDGEQAALDGARAVEADGRHMEVVIVNPAMVFGPGEEPRGRTRGILRAVSRGLLRVVPPGGITLCDVRDVAAAHVAALTHGRVGERHILGGACLEYRRLAELLGDAVGRRARPLVLPARLLSVGLAPLRALDSLAGDLFPVEPAYAAQVLAHAFYSSKKAERELGYAPRPVEQTLRDTVGWYRAEGLL